MAATFWICFVHQLNLDLWIKLSPGDTQFLIQWARHPTSKKVKLVACSSWHALGEMRCFSLCLRNLLLFLGWGMFRSMALNRTRYIIFLRRFDVISFRDTKHSWTFIIVNLKYQWRNCSFSNLASYNKIDLNQNGHWRAGKRVKPVRPSRSIHFPGWGKRVVAVNEPANARWSSESFRSGFSHSRNASRWDHNSVFLSPASGRSCRGRPMADGGGD